MTRSIATISVGIALLATAGAANAQAMPGSGSPAPGTGDSTKIVQGNREANAAYNQLIGAADSTQPAKKQAHAASTAAVAATAADLTVGSALRDSKGVHIGAVSQVDPDGVVVDTGTTKIKVPATAFGKDSQGLMLGITAEKFNELIAKAHAAH